MRTILHSDLNNFYASVEVLYHPEYASLPVVVCGRVEDRHGIVLAKNMLAKKAGVKTGMVLFEVKKLCPDVVCLEAHHDLYLKYSRAVRRIYNEYTDRVEPFGIDEAWLDVTSSPKFGGDGYLIAEDIRRRIKEEIGLTVSIGVSFNKVFAKLGSDLKKPDAVTLISRENYKEKVWGLPVSDLLYVGRATKKKLEMLNIKTIGELAGAMDRIVISKLGKWGEVLLSYARGEDAAPVLKAGEHEPIKSVGNSITFYRDIKTDEDVYAILILLAESVSARMKEAGFSLARTLSLVVRSADLEFTLRTTKLGEPSNLSGDFADAAFELFKKNFSWSNSVVRMLGISVSDFCNSMQLSMNSLGKNKDKLMKLEVAVEGVRRKYGRGIINRAIVCRDKHMQELDIKGDIGALSKEKMYAPTLELAKYK